MDISNNLAENAIRLFVVGRKNWLFSDTPKGADSSAVIYSLVESAKANEFEPRSHLWFLLDELRYLDKSPSAAELETLMPWGSYTRVIIERLLFYWLFREKRKQTRKLSLTCLRNFEN